MKKIVAVIAAIVLILPSHRALAWGGWAHRFIAYTAEQYLDPEVKTKVEKYLGSSIVDHCTWMDWVRPIVRDENHPQHDYYMAYAHTLRCHMMTINKDMKVSNERAYNNCGDLLPNLKKSIANLKNHRNLTDSAVVVNLKCAIHMLEDMHCPSHIYFTEFPDCFPTPGSSSRRDCFEMSYEGEATLYHKVWDGRSLLELYPEYNEDYDKFLAKLDNFSPKKRAKICEGTIEDWAEGNARDCRAIYDWAKPGDNIDRNFLLKHRKLSVQQYHRASYRLAYILNETMR